MGDTDDDAELLRVQDRAITQRMAAVDDLAQLVDLVMTTAPSIPDLLDSLMLTQMQIYGVRKAVVAEARAVGMDEVEIARALRMGFADFASCYPPLSTTRSRRKS